MRRDYAPVGQTCPIIDDVISLVHNVYSDSEDFSRQTYDHFEKQMEKIRQANSTLREWGNEECQRAEELEKDLDYEKDRVKELEGEVASLKNDIKDLEKEINLQNS